MKSNNLYIKVNLIEDIFIKNNFIKDELCKFYYNNNAI
jgi:hypothetical protein